VGPAFGSFFGTLSAVSAEKNKAAMILDQSRGRVWNPHRPASPTLVIGKNQTRPHPLSFAGGAFGSFFGMAAAVCCRDCLGLALRAWLSSSVSSSCSLASPLRPGRLPEPATKNCQRTAGHKRGTAPSVPRTSAITKQDKPAYWAKPPQPQARRAAQCRYWSSASLAEVDKMALSCWQRAKTTPDMAGAKFPPFSSVIGCIGWLNESYTPQQQGGL
jgi:hypothetical protein